MLEVKNISLKLGDKLLFENLSFSVSAGQMLCISGASGCGKTSLLKAIMGFIPVKGGFISIDGEQVTAESSIVFRRHMAYLPQESSLPCQTVRELVQLPFSLHANQKAVFSEDVMFEEWQKLGLQKSLYDKKTSEISGGQRQRMMIATCKMLNKKILIVDEPTSALDAETSMAVASYLADIASGGAIILCVSHDAAFASRCSKTIML